MKTTIMREANIPDSQLYCVYGCKEDNCEEVTSVNPSWHQENGTPMCPECDVNMEFIYVRHVMPELPVYRPGDAIDIPEEHREKVNTLHNSLKSAQESLRFFSDESRLKKKALWEMVRTVIPGLETLGLLLQDDGKAVVVSTSPRAEEILGLQEEGKMKELMDKPEMVVSVLELMKEKLVGLQQFDEAATVRDVAQRIREEYN